MNPPIERLVAPTVPYRAGAIARVGRRMAMFSLVSVILSVAIRTTAAWAPDLNSGRWVYHRNSTDVTNGVQQSYDDIRDSHHYYHYYGHISDCVHGSCNADNRLVVRK